MSKQEQARAARLDIAASKPGFLAKLALLAHWKTAEAKPCTSLQPSANPLTDEIRGITDELAKWRKEVQMALPTSPEEEFAMARIRALEDTRFDLLSRLHGNRVEAYGLR